MNTAEQKNYLIAKYNEYAPYDEWFTPYINPTDSFIPLCTQCSLDFENFKKNNIQEGMEVEMKHSKSCLWADYFINKIRNVCGDAKIVRKIKKKEKI
jgi:hypothetical protein